MKAAARMGKGGRKMKRELIKIVGTGNQAPYGIGEIIDIVPQRNIAQIKRAMRKWHNPPALRGNDTGYVYQVSDDGRSIQVANTLA